MANKAYVQHLLQMVKGYSHIHMTVLLFNLIGENEYLCIKKKKNQKHRVERKQGVLASLKKEKKKSLVKVFR